MTWENVEWRKSSRSGTGSNCVEVAVTPDRVGARDSKNVTGPRLEFTPAAWLEFVYKIQNGGLD